MDASSSTGSAEVDLAKRKGRSKITNGTAFLPGIDNRGPWIRRAKDVVAAHLSDIPDPTAAERSIIRRAAVLTVELERLESAFAVAGAADPETLDLYGRTAGNLRRLLEAVGISRRDARDITPSLSEYLRDLDKQATEAVP